MADKKTALKLHGGSFPFWSLLFGGLAAIFYHSLTAGAAVFLLSFIAGILTYAGFVPVFGPFLYIWGYKSWLEPNVFALGGIAGGSIITDVIFYAGLLCSILFTIVATVGVGALILVGFVALTDK